MIDMIDVIDHRIALMAEAVVTTLPRGSKYSREEDRISAASS
jgi:hypothetical protein